MKKKLFISIVILLIGSSCIFAQNDGFFTTTYSGYRDNNWASTMPSIPGYHGSLDDYEATPEAPLGSGLFVMAALGLAYGVKRKRS